MLKIHFLLRQSYRQNVSYSARFLCISYKCIIINNEQGYFTGNKMLKIFFITVMTV